MLRSACWQARKTRRQVHQLGEKRDGRSTTLGEKRDGRSTRRGAENATPSPPPSRAVSAGAKHKGRNDHGRDPEEQPPSGTRPRIVAPPAIRPVPVAPSKQCLTQAKAGDPVRRDPIRARSGPRITLEDLSERPWGGTLHLRGRKSQALERASSTPGLKPWLRNRPSALHSRSVAVLFSPMAFMSGSGTRGAKPPTTSSSGTRVRSPSPGQESHLYRSLQGEAAIDWMHSKQPEQEPVEGMALNAA